jgi:hypothetical protein
VRGSVTVAEYRAIQAEEMREAALQEAVRRRTRAYGLRMHYFHVWGSAEHSPAGFPDVTIWTKVGALYRELKRECTCTRTRRRSCKSHPTEAQVAWLETGAAAGFDVGLWTPADLVAGRVDEEIAAVVRPGWCPYRNPLYRYGCICGSVHLADRRQVSKVRLAA